VISQELTIDLSKTKLEKKLELQTEGKDGQTHLLGRLEKLEMVRVQEAKKIVYEPTAGRITAGKTWKKQKKLCNTSNYIIRRNGIASAAKQRRSSTMIFRRSR
jgi:hypothetical protein